MENNTANTIPIDWFESSCGIAQNTSFEYPICKQHKTEFISISLCTKGCTKVLCNGKEIIHSKNSFIVIMDNEMIDYNKEHSPDFNHYLLILSPDFFKAQIIKDFLTHFLYFRYHPFIETTEEETRYLIDLFKLIKKTIEQKSGDGKGKRLSILFNLLFETVFQTEGYLKGVNSSIEPRIEELFKQFIILLETYYNQSREVSFYADKLCI